jgi:hypothetical protein
MRSTRSEQIERLREPIRGIVQAYDNWESPFEREMYPDKRALVDIDGTRDRALYLTHTLSLNYHRNAERVTSNTKSLWDDEHWVFEPDLVVDKGEDALRDVFNEQGLRYPNRDAGIWYRNSTVLYREFDSNPLRLLEVHDFDAEQILSYVRGSDFTYLGGQKIGPLWMRHIHEDVHQLSNIHRMEMPVDTHIRKVTNRLLGGSQEDDAIRSFWREFCSETGLDPVKVDRPLWLIGNHWEEWGREYLRDQVGEFGSLTQSEEIVIPNRREFDSDDEWVGVVADELGVDPGIVRQIRQ